MSKKGYIHLPTRHALAGVGAAMILAGPSAALAEVKLCPVTFALTNAVEIGALEFTADYAAATALGDINEPDCVFHQSGTTDVLYNEPSDETTLGYADTTGFTGPAEDIATCYFALTNADSAAPVAGNFVITIDDASDTDALPVVPTIGVTVGACFQAGSCALAPATGCKVSTASGKSQVSFKNDAADDTKDQGQFKWKGGAATNVDELGTPLDAGETYSWCVYDDGTLIYGGDVPAAAATWKATGTKGFGFKGDADGIAQIKMKTGAAGKASVQVKAKSKAGNFESPALQLGTGVVSQLVINDGTPPFTCFQTTPGTPKKDTEAAYSAKD